MKGIAVFILTIFIVLFLLWFGMWQAVSGKKIKSQEKELKGVKSTQQTLKQEVAELKQKPSRSFSSVPEKLIFCGEEVPLEREYVKERLDEALNFEKNRNSAIESIFKRSGRWFSFIENELRNRSLPLDLRYLPVIESDLNPDANSNMGARGMWQLTRGTAQRYKLRVDYLIDERYDPFKSTRAAVEHLQDLYSEFGNWSKALATYNMDMASFKKAVEKEKANDFYQVRGIPLETQRFIFRILATKMIMEHPEKYGYPREESIEKLKYQKWQVREIDLVVEKATASRIEIVEKLKARYPDLTYWDFLTHNRHILRDLPRGKYKIYVYSEK